jgi:hypothetical protein
VVAVLGLLAGCGDSGAHSTEVAGCWPLPVPTGATSGCTPSGQQFVTIDGMPHPIYGIPKQPKVTDVHGTFKFVVPLDYQYPTPGKICFSVYLIKLGTNKILGHVGPGCTATLQPNTSTTLTLTSKTKYVPGPYLLRYHDSSPKPAPRPRVTCPPTAICIVGA